MATAAERALSGATQLNNIGYVEFTTSLVRDTYSVIVQSSMEQLEAYADFVTVISKGLDSFQQDAIGNEEETTASYASDVLSLEADNNGDNYIIDKEIREGLIEHFSSISIVTDAAATPPESKTIEEVITATATSATKVVIHNFITEKLKGSAKHSYDMLVTILQIGMQKIVVSEGEIHTKLSFSVEANDTQNRTKTDRERKASKWGVKAHLNGSIGGGGGIMGMVSKALLGGSISGGVGGGYSSNKLMVSVVNERSSAATNVKADILGEVRIKFRTESFPQVSSSAVTSG